MNVRTVQKGNKIVARMGNRQHTHTVDPNIPRSANHGLAAAAIVVKVVPASWKNHQLNGMKAKGTDKGFVFTLPDRD